MPTLYGVGLSPFVRKVRVVLAEKSVPYDHDPVVPGNPDPEDRKMSPLGKIPALRDGDRAFSDSSVSSASADADGRSARELIRLGDQPRP
jgi:glutathione S-transferase